MRYANHKTRRGVLLLVILALLAMFGMVAVTFVVVASQARLAAEAHQRLDETTDPPRKLLNAGILQVLRGSTNPASAIGPHSLLEDVYGNRSEQHTASGAAPAASGELITVTVSMPISDARGRIGGVLTVVPDATGMTAMVGRSARILDAVESGSNSILTLLPFEGVSVSDALGVLTGNFPVIISGTPFSGTGFGWRNGVEDTREEKLALRPGSLLNRDSGILANEDYDAADFQNMILAAQIPLGTTGQVLTIPSLHRPALVNNRDTGADYMLRPTKNQHPNFTGGNVNGATALGFDPVNGPWDVDNDGDGIADSIWVDLGMPARAAADGQLYKPLFAILCVDMDGKLNVNAHGSSAQATAAYYTTPAPATDDSQQFPTPLPMTPLLRGQGLGPAEINLVGLFNGDGTAYATLLTGRDSTYGRYGANGVPGPDVDLLCRHRWMDYDYATGYWPVTGSPNYGTWSGYGAPPDLHGVMAVGLDRAGRPIWDKNLCGQAGAENPYEFNPVSRAARGPLGGGNEAFSPAELERILRCYDRDTLTLPPRLFELLRDGGADVPYLRHDMATDSVDTPVPGGIRDPSSGTWYPTFIELLQARGIDAVRAAELFGPDLAAGRKLNLNRPLPASDLVARQELARHLFCLAMLLRDPAYRFPWPKSPPGPPDPDPNIAGNEDKLTIKRIAQWAVNVVDFIDADSTMTPFEYVEDPFVSGVTWPTGNPTGINNLVWGMERPVLLLTETLAFHDRRVADTAFDDSTRAANQKKRTDKKTGSDPSEPADDDLDQPRMPQGSLFVELYCAMEPGTKPTSDLYKQDPKTGQMALDLSKKVGINPVWRLAITKSAKASPGSNNVAQRLNGAPATFSLETDQGASLVAGAAVPDIEIERIVSFVSAALPQLPGTPRLYYNRNGDSIYLTPGEYLVVGPRKTTAVGSTPGTPPGQSPQQIILDPTVAQQVKITNLSGGTSYPASIKDPKAMVAAAAWPGNDTGAIGISVSEPIPDSYYPIPTHTGSDGAKDWYGDPSSGPFPDKPLEDRSSAFPIATDNMTETGTYQAYRYVLLQRLADPTRGHDAVNNPYRTVDWMPIDLTVFNGQDVIPEWPPLWAVDSAGNPVDVGDWDLDDPDPNAAVEFDTRERGKEGGADQNLWEQGQFSTPQPTARGSASAHFPCDLEHSLGYLNTTFGTPGSGTGIHQGDPATPFPWITWNNRPPASPYELMMVPATTAARHGWEFTMASGAGPSAPYTPGADAGQYVYNAANVGYTHLMNFFHSSDTSGTASELHRIFDYVATPSRFAGAQHYVSGITDERDRLQPTYREPGKINLNTIYSERVFRGLMNGFGEGTNLWNQFFDSRRGYDVTDAANYPTQFARPFTSSTGAHLCQFYLPTTATLTREVEWGLLRSRGLLSTDPTDPLSKEPLFAFASNAPVNDTNRNPYFRHQGLMRLANLTTTRSNVYAVWITVGYFEATPTSDTSIPGGYLLGRELGVETGEIRRHRAFYMIDRSIPVGFVRGEDMNVESTIMLQRYVE